MFKNLITVVSLVTSLQAFSADKFNQIGQWSKEYASEASGVPVWVEQKFQSTARFLGATAMYLGEFNGQHLAVTNWHVCPRHMLCTKYPLRFPQMKKVKVEGEDELQTRAIRVDDLLISVKAIDFAIVSLKVGGDQVLLQELKTLEQNFSWEYEYKEGTPLVTMGFGHHLNPKNRMKYEMAGNCKLAEEGIRLIDDPDQQNSADFQVWSAATGCDASGNDSGSPFYDLNSRELIGLLWTARRPRWNALESQVIFDELASNRSLSQARIQELITDLGLPQKYFEDVEGEEITLWNTLTYLVPAPSIKRVLCDEIETRFFLDDSYPVTILEMLGGKCKPEEGGPQNTSY